jgi:hypothetical protein
MTVDLNCWSGWSFLQQLFFERSAIEPSIVEDEGGDMVWAWKARHGRHGMEGMEGTEGMEGRGAAGTEDGRNRAEGCYALWAPHPGSDRDAQCRRSAVLLHGGRATLP